MAVIKIPHTFPAKEFGEIPKARFASTIRHSQLTPGCHIGLIGLPDDEGVRRNYGRPGARDGPRAFREALSRFGVAMPHGFDWPIVFDAGDVQSGNDIYDTHNHVTEAITSLLELGLFPIAIGGGHDLTFPIVRSLSRQYTNLVGLYCDAHLDVRAEVGSGMAFRKIIEECHIRELHNQGFRSYVNSREHIDWFKTHGGHIEAFAPQNPWPAGDCFFSLDLDVVDSAHAPGVSAPNPAGWSVRQAEEWVTAAGRNKSVRSFDIMELNPSFDADSRTARVAAYLFLCFLHGYAQRDG